MLQFDKRVSSFAWGLLVFFAVAARDATARPGDPDSSFGVGGFVGTDFTSQYESSRAVAVQNDGKVVLLGESEGRVAIVRYESTGALDTTFGIDGKVLTVSTEEKTAFVTPDFALQTDGKLVVAVAVYVASISSTSRRIALLRYDADGSLDSSFGDGGIVNVSLPMGTARDRTPLAVAVQSDGRIVILRSAFFYGFVIARFGTDGMPDSSFGDDGIVIRSDMHAKDLALKSDGRIVVAGHVRFSGFEEELAVTRYNGDGSLDVTFGIDGTATTRFGADDESFGTSVSVQDDGRIVVVGNTYREIGFPASGWYWGVVRFNADGTLDETFGTAGHSVPLIRSSRSEQALAVAVQADGKVVVGGSTSGENGNLYAMVRYEADGRLDTGFGCNGKVTYFNLIPPDWYGTSNFSPDIALQSDGGILVSGQAIASRFNNRDLALARFEGGDCVGPECSADQDADGVVDACDACQNATQAVATHKVNVAHVALPQRIISKFALRGKFLVEAPMTPDDVVADGIRIIAMTRDDALIFDITIPGGAGWSAARTIARFRDSEGLNNGMRRVKFRGRGDLVPTEITLRLLATRGHNPVFPGDEEIKVSIVLGQGPGQCAETAFAAGECAFNQKGDRLKCG
jgi:uncharacterized delta-60 repeat protein